MANRTQMEVVWEAKGINKAVVTVVSGVCAVAGILLVLNSPTMGLAATGSWLRSVGGSADGTQYQAMMSAYTAAYRLLGGIVLGGGILGLLQQMRDGDR